MRASSWLLAHSLSGRCSRYASYLRGTTLTTSAAALLLAFGLAGCERRPPAPPATPTPATASAPVRREVELPPAMQACATQPAGITTGLFLDRQQPTDVRVVSYNVNFDSIFPDKNKVRPERFQRIIKALDPDVLNLQEIKEKDAADTAALMDAIDPLPSGRWQTYKGWTNVIVSKFPLRMTASHTVPAGQRDLAMALVDLPDSRFGKDLYVLNNHFKCCGGTGNDPDRQRQADALVNWLRDARMPGGEFDLPPHTPIIICGDFNLVGGRGPLETLLTGDISDEGKYGPDSPPDWDNSDLTDAHPLQNGVGPDDYTWRSDTSDFKPGRLDFMIYTDTVLAPADKFVLNTTTMSDADLERARLQRLDVALDADGRDLDHLPVVVDFRLVGP